MFDVTQDGNSLQFYPRLNGGIFRTKGPGEDWKTTRLRGLFPIHLYNNLLYVLRRDPLAGGDWLVPIKPSPGDGEVLLLVTKAIKDDHECVRMRYYEKVNRETTTFDIYLEYTEVYEWVRHIDENMTC